MNNVAINGFGRIGRSILRIIVEQDIDINVVAINDLGDYENLAYLFKHDSIMGILNANISIQNETLKINEREIKLISISEPSKLPWKELSVDIVIESGFIHLQIIFYCAFKRCECKTHVIVTVGVPTLAESPNVCKVVCPSNHDCISKEHLSVPVGRSALLQLGWSGMREHSDGFQGRLATTFRMLCARAFQKDRTSAGYLRFSANSQQDLAGWQLATPIKSCLCARAFKEYNNPQDICDSRKALNKT